MKIKILLSVFSLFSTSILCAQVDSLKMSLDLRTRSELDNGQKTLIPQGRNAENTVYSRARFGFQYFYDKLETHLSIQDVRTWGETNSSNSSNQNLTLFEAWAKYNFNPNVALKIGRQVLSYDDERLIGALDWAMQARSFDAAKGIFNISPKSKIEAVLTYNSDNLNNAGNREIYELADGGERTKSLQIIHYQYKGNHHLDFSTILMNNSVQALSGTHYSLLTMGANLKKYTRNIGFFGSFYYQTGKNSNAQIKNAYQFSANIDFIFTPKINTIIGSEWLSGNQFDTDPKHNRAFSPLYGTNHKFNGYMDYFYVGNYFNSFGLNDYYLKSNFKFTPKSMLNANIHAFSSNGKIDKTHSSYLGTELDLVFNHKINKNFALFIGHSFMFASPTLKVVKSVSTPKNIQTWSWIGLHFTPTFKLL